MKTVLALALFIAVAAAASVDNVSSIVTFEGIQQQRMTQLLSHILQGLPLCLRPITSPIKNRSCIQLSKRCQKLQNFDFQSQFSMSEIIRIFLFFSLKNINLGAHFCY